MGKQLKYDELKQLLVEEFEQLKKAQKHLLFSFQKAKTIDIHKDDFSEEEFEVLEAMCSRFARVSDMLVKRIFRLIDQIELEDKNLSIIDRIANAEKRKLINNELDFRNIRELRNEIAHEYRDQQYKEFFEDVLGLVSILNDSISRVEKYVQNLDIKKD